MKAIYPLKNSLLTYWSNGAAYRHNRDRRQTDRSARLLEWYTTRAGQEHPGNRGLVLRAWTAGEMGDSCPEQSTWLRCPDCGMAAFQPDQLALHLAEFCPQRSRTLADNIRAPQNGNPPDENP